MNNSPWMSTLDYDIKNIENWIDTSDLSNINKNTFKIDHKMYYNSKTNDNFTFPKSKDQSEINSLILGNINYYLKEFADLARQDIIEDGVYSMSEKYILNIFEKNQSLAREILNKAAWEYMEFPKISVSILHIISHFDKDEIVDIYKEKLIALSFLTNKDNIVKEYVIKAFESWEDKNDVAKLEQLDIQVEWLKKYRDQVIKGLKKEE